MTTTPALIITGEGVNIDNTLPGGSGGSIDNTLPGGRPGRVDNTLPTNPPVGMWPPPAVIWPPVPPITIDIDPDVGISLPIVLPGTPGNDLPPVDVDAVRPGNPIVLPPPPGLGALLALVLPLPGATPKGGPAGAQAALLWYGPGTVPVVVYLGSPVATPKAHV